MSVVHCAILSKPTSLKRAADYSRQISEEYLIRTNSATDGIVAVESGAQSASPHALPAMWSSYSHPVTGDTLPNIYLQQRSIERVTAKEGGKTIWKAKCSWMPPPPGQNAQLPDNPILWPVQFSLEWASHTRLMEYDITGRPIANTAGDLFDPVEIDDARPVLVAVKNMSSLAAIISLAITYKNAINNSTFYGAPAYAAKVESITSGTLQTTNDFSYYPMTIRIQFTNPNEFSLGWDIRLLNQGPHYLDASGNKARVRVLDGDKKGQFLQKALLDADGNQIPDGDPGILVPLDADPTPYFRLYPPKNFAGLGIGIGV